MFFYVAEFYLPRGASLDSVVRRAKAGAAEAASCGHQIRFVRAVFVPPDETCLIMYLAESAGQVNYAGTRSGFDFDRVSEAQTAS
jgi:hypothetical protein